MSLPRTSLFLSLEVAILLSIVGCGKVGTVEPAVRPTLQSLSEKSLPLSSSKSAESGRTNEREGDSSTSTEPEQLPSSTFLPTFLYPNGSEVALTPPGTVLPFGKPATVATADSEGRLLVWTITAHDAVSVPRENVALVSPERANDVSRFSCYAYDLTFLGAVVRDPQDPLILIGVSDTANTAVPTPTLTPANRDGDISKHVVGGADNACGIPDITRVPTTASLLEVGYPYAGGAVEAIAREKQPDEADNGAIYQFDKEFSGVSGKSAPPEPIRWK